MKNLWAPWRIHFIEELRDKSSGCVFCEITCGKDDRKNLILHRGKYCYVLMNKYPYNNGHLLIIPYKHTGNLKDLSSPECAEMMQLTAAAVSVIENVMQAEGFNIGINLGKVAGAGFDKHVHQHIVPRWNGDNNFMPVLADTRSIPEYLESTYDKLVDGFKDSK